MDTFQNINNVTVKQGQCPGRPVALQFQEADQREPQADLSHGLSCVLLKSQVTTISSVASCVYESSELESFCFWLIKSCVCSKILHFLPHFGSTEGIRTVVNCLFLSSSGFCGRKFACLLLAYVEPELSRQQLLLGEQQKRK